jgi:hypothetical protein
MADPGTRGCRVVDASLETVPPGNEDAIRVSSAVLRVL